MSLRTKIQCVSVTDLNHTVGHKCHVSSKSVSWGGGGGGGGGHSCIKIGYSEPAQAKSREGSSSLAESSRVT